MKSVTRLRDGQLATDNRIPIWVDRQKQLLFPRKVSLVANFARPTPTHNPAARA